MPTADQATCKRELLIEVPPEVVREEVEKIAHEFQKRARVPGFRPGKTPLSLVKQRFRDEIRDEAVQHLVSEFFGKRVREDQLELVESPGISDVSLDLDADSTLRFKASFEVMPSFELDDYAGLRVEVPEPEVSDEDVESELKKLQENQATFVPVEDRALEDHDFASISFEGRPKEAAAAEPSGEGEEGAAGEKAQKKGGPVKLDDVLCEIAGENTFPEFTENLRGARPGEQRTFEVTYPEDFDNRQLAGQTLVYDVRVNSIKKKQMPEMTDDFARDLGDFRSIEEVRNSIRQQILGQRQHAGEHEAKDKLMNQLINRHDFPVPETLVEKQLRTRMERTVRQITSQGVDPSKVNIDWGRVRESHREGAIRDVKASLILERIADKEQIEVSEQETQREIEQLVRQMRPKDAAAVRERLTRPGAADGIKSRLRNDKALDLVYRQAEKTAAPVRIEPSS